MVKTLAVCLALLALTSTADATIINYEPTNLGGATWRYDYSVTNNSLSSGISEFSVFFGVSYANLIVSGSPADWDSLVVQPDPGIPDDGWLDSLALGGPLALGSSIGGFAVEFEWLGAGTPGAQLFAILDPDTFDSIETGSTSLRQTQPPASVPEPPAVWLLGVGLAALLTSGRRARRLEEARMRPTLRDSAGYALAVALGALASLFPHPADAAAQVTGIQLVSSERSGRTAADYTYRLTVANGSPALTNASVTVTSSSAAILVVDGNVQAGTLAANASTMPADTFVIRIDRTVAFNPAALSYAVTGTPPPPPTLSGIAAVGVPLAGTVTVKDALGATRTVPIGTNGSYSVDVSGMTAPFVLRAEGMANGHTYTVHSGATAADVGGNINVTQLTDLAIANIAGQIAQSYFDAGNFGSLTPSALNAEVTLLRERLLPVLRAVGVDASIDLLRSRFTPLASALDTALDTLRVSYNLANNTATIVDIVTLQQIQDNLAVPAAGETNPSVLTQTGGLASAGNDMGAVRAALATFASKFAAGLPAPATLESLMGASFLFRDEDRATTAADFASDSALVGSVFTDVDFKLLDYNSPPEVRAVVDFTVKEPGGFELGRLRGFAVRKDPDGVWRLYGDQRVLAAGGNVHPDRSVTTGCMTTGLEFNLSDPNPANDGGVINHINVVGPGLPAGGVRFNRPLVGGDWDSVGNAETFASTCGGAVLSDAQIAAIPDNAIYLLLPYASADNSVRINFPSGAIVAPGTPVDGAYSLLIERRPPTLAELVAGNSFPTIAAPTPAAFASYNGGPLTISVGNMIQTSIADLILEYRTALGNDARLDAPLPLTGLGTINAVLELPQVPAGDVITFRSFRVGTNDIYHREFMTEVANTAVNGTVSGLTGSVTLRLNGANDVAVNASGLFGFAGSLLLGTAYTATIASQPATQLCVITNPNGTVGGGAPVSVTCKNYSLGGSIAGLTGSGLVLQVNGGGDLGIGTGATGFTFPPSTSLRLPNFPSSVTYTAHIKTQPAGQTCTILNAAGIIPFGAPNVASVNVICVANVTDPLSGTYKRLLQRGIPVQDRIYLTLYPDGTYIFGLHQIPGGACLPGEPEDLVQYGAYRYDQASGQFAIDRVLHSPANGCGGLDDDLPVGQFTTIGTLTKNPDGTLLMDAGGGNTLTFTPVTSIPGTLIGSWGDNQGFDVFGNDGTLFSATTKALVGVQGVSPGVEDGCYLLSGTTSAGSFTVNFAGTCAVSGTQTAVDTTGANGGYSLLAVLGLARPFVVAGDALTLTPAPPIRRIDTDTPPPSSGGSAGGIWDVRATLTVCGYLCNSPVGTVYQGTVTISTPDASGHVTGTYGDYLPTAAAIQGVIQGGAVDLVYTYTTFAGPGEGICSGSLDDRTITVTCSEFITGMLNGTLNEVWTKR